MKMVGVEQNDNNVDYNPEILNGEYDFGSAMQMLGESQERKNAQERDLTEQEFKERFSGDHEHCYKQSNLGNCRMIAALDSVTHLGNYKNLIMENVKKTNDGFKIWLPMGAPKGEGKYYYTKVNMPRQIQLNGKALNLLDYNEYEEGTEAWEKREQELKNNPRHESIGLGCLLHALGQKLTGSTDFSYVELTYGPTGSLIPFQSLVYGFSAETQYNTDIGKDRLRNMGIDLDKYYGRDKNKLKNHLENFDPRTQSMTVMLKTDNSYNIDESFHPVITFDGFMNKIPDHVVSVDRVVKNGSGELEIWLSDPHTASDNDKEIKKYSFDKLINIIGAYTFASFDADMYNMRGAVAATQHVWTKYLASGKASDHDNSTLGSEVEGQSYTLNTLGGKKVELSQRFVNLSDSRGRVIVNELDTNSGSGSKKDLEVRGWGEKIKLIDNGKSVKMRIPGKSSFLEMNNNLFVSDKYVPSQKSGEGDILVEDYYHGSACRMALFTECMISEYIKPNIGETKNPFALKDGKLVFDIDRTKVDVSKELPFVIGQGISDKVDDLSNAVSSAMEPTVKKAQGVVSDVKSSVKSGLNSYGLGGLYDGARDFYHAVGDAASYVKNQVGNVVSDVSDAIGETAQMIGERAYHTAGQIYDYYKDDVTMLENWSTIGLENNTVSKQKVVDFLNQLYTEYN